MVAGNHRVGGSSIVVAVVVGLGMIVAGCNTVSQAPGLPRGVQAVGGGLQIYWKAPSDGTVYLVEQASRKIIETKSLDAGEIYEFDIDAEDAEVFEKVTGLNLTPARLALYFKPAE
jgi:hypothetical protein